MALTGYHKLSRLSLNIVICGDCMGKAEKIHVPIDFAFLLLVEGKHLI